MSPDEQSLLNGLFERLRTASTTPRDREAEAYIDQAVRAQPSAPYYLSQAVIVQEKGLEAAAQRIEDLEAELRHARERIEALEAHAGAPDTDPSADQRSGSFLGSLFGSSERPHPGQDAARTSASRPAPAEQRPLRPSPAPWGVAPPEGVPNSYAANSYAPNAYQRNASGPWDRGQQPPSAAGGFLRGAMGTAAGVAGGMLLANSLSGLFGNHMSSLGLGSATETVAPVEETTINNYYGNDAVTNASDPAAASDASPDASAGDWQQADLDTGGDDGFDSGFDGGSDDSMDV
jgi:hypothetical protein